MHLQDSPASNQPSGVHIYHTHGISAGKGSHSSSTACSRTTGNLDQPPAGVYRTQIHAYPPLGPTLLTYAAV